MTIERIAIIGTGLIGSSIGLALKSVAPHIHVVGYDRDPQELAAALKISAIDQAITEHSAADPDIADVFVLATPVLPIMHWMKVLTSAGKDQLITDVGSTKHAIADLANTLYSVHGATACSQARFLPGHPMAGKESGGAALADATLFQGATWLFTPLDDQITPIEHEWRSLVAQFGAHIQDMPPSTHDEICAWVSHLPQMLSTALAALLQDHFAADPAGLAAVQAIGGRALRETTRLGASPYSMWRDVALTNTENIAATLLSLEQRLTHIRENLRTPELREEFSTANRFKPTPRP
jgi:prephenate dehydrogenase